MNCLKNIDLHAPIFNMQINWCQLVQLEICNSQSSTGAPGNMHTPVINWCNENMPTVTGLSPRNLNGNCETIKTPKNNSFSHLENTEYPAYIIIRLSHEIITAELLATLTTI